MIIRRFDRIRVDSGSALAFLLTLLFALAAYHFYSHGGLIKGHRYYAEQVYRGNYFVNPHIGLFLLSSLLAHLDSIPIQQAMDYVLSLHVALTFFVAFWVFDWLGAEVVSPWLQIAGAFAVMFAMPIGLPFLNESVYAFNHDSRAAFLLRNGTHTAVQPYAFAAFGLLYVVLRQERTQRAPLQQAALAGSLLAASAVIKPSFAVSIIPAILAYLCLSWRYSIRSYAKIIAMLLPAALVILWEYYAGFMAPEGRRLHITYAPLLTWKQANLYPLLAFVLALAFPLWLSFFRWKKLSDFTRIAWLNLAIALIPYSLLNVGDRDFEWSYINARQIMFLCCIVEWWKWLKQERADKSARQLPECFAPVHMAGVLLMAHCMFGYIRMLTVGVM